ncbi:glycosyltransferase family 4 protein [Treponema parvum]|uniref:Glycosyltransferase family 4 protein n=1 Tax=Treponema parvum TaxID=138851 RepID=A0A975EZK8_9SPIR|nr:glycosyltransferase family 1 protein [Treponema parvum]QTQ11764.1 glycosyltransferase family 4 protein [Treponema parvum]QTQ16268.1 glycosyltransferase family 4 protein [Treponema parvum]
MRLAIDCRMIDSGGIGTYVSELIPYFLKKDQCLLLGTHEQCTAFLRKQNVEFCFCDVRPFSFAEFFSFPKDVLDKINSCDAYYTPYCNIPSGIKIPIYSTIHDVVFLDVKGLSSPLGNLMRKFIYKRAIRLSKAVFTVSEFSKDRILYRLHCKKNIIVGYNGLPSWVLKDDEDAHELPEEDQKQTENQNQTSKSLKDENTILFVGNIKKHKGLSILLEAYSQAKKQIKDLNLVIVGNAENFRTGDKEIIERFQDITDGSVTFTGKINNSKLKKQYKKAKLLVQPSFYEGFGIPPLEALCCGTNAVISDIPVFKEIYKDFPVIFFKCGDAEDLSKQIVLHLNDEVPKLPENIYSYKDTADIILNTICKNL